MMTNNNINKQDLKNQDLKHLSPMSDWKTLNDEGGRKIITRGEGVYFWDAEDRKYLDGMAGLWCVNLGYSCQPIKEAVANQLEVLPYYNAFFKTTNEPTAELSELLAQITPEKINHFFYGCSGSDANDTIFKLVRRYFQNLEQPKKKIFISRKNAYHGSTVLSANLGGMDPMHQLNDLVINDIVHIDQPYTFGAGKPLNDHQFGLEMAKQLEDKILELGADSVAAFIGEPIQGAGGVIIPPDSYWPEVQRICRKHGVLLISDEVICGFGRTGTWFGCQQWGVEPDLMTMAKGITSGYQPLSAVGVSDDFYQGLISKAKEFAHGYTYSGHPAATRAGVATIKHMLENNMLEQVKQKMVVFKQLGEELKSHPMVGEVRSRGMLMAIELVKDKSTNEKFKSDIGTVCRDICVENGLIMRACKHAMVLSPPLVITEGEMKDLFSLAKNILDQTLEASKNLD